MLTQSTDLSYRHVNENEGRKWSVPGDNTAYERAEGQHGGARVYGDLTETLELNPRFQLDRSSPVFTIGSCFARNVEEALMAEGFNVLTRSGHFPYEHGYLNRYNTPAMIQELEFAFGRRSFDPASIVTMRAGFADLTSYGAFQERTEVAEHRRITTDLFRTLPTAGLVVITAGLSEVWFDRQFNLFTNVSPSEAGRSEPERFEFRLLDFATNFRVLESLILLAKEVAPACRILMTVSPVPLNATFVQRDVVISNTYSKACLRAAVEELYWKYDFIDYFPSYEMVASSNPALVWEPDHRHVKPDFVRRIMAAFVRHYVRG